MSPEQCRAARAWLDWTQHELARRAGVGLSTVKDFEKGNRKPIRNNLDALHRVFIAAGIIPTFKGDRATGIAISDDTLIVTAAPEYPGRPGKPGESGGR
jgi:transcriptional regulator with XRE-family HTH domain